MMKRILRSYRSQRLISYRIEKGKPFIFTAEVALKPEVTLGEYKGLKVEKISNRVTQKEIDAKLAEEQEKNARTVSVTDVRFRIKMKSFLILKDL